MDENEFANLDIEFERYLQLLRPYLLYLVDENVIKLCDAWIHRLSNCQDNEKSLRNKYIFVLCYQLAKGILDKPFLKYPTDELQPFCDGINSDESSSEVECVVVNTDKPKTKVLFDTNKITTSESDYQSHLEDTWNSSMNKSERLINKNDPMQTDSKSFHKQTIFCYQYPDGSPTVRDYVTIQPEGYEIRANNLVQKLREIKLQNVLLRRELFTLREEAKSTHDDYTEDYIIKVDNATSPYVRSTDSSSTLESLKSKLQEIQNSRNALIQTISNLQEQLDNFNELKINEIDDIEAKHKLELIKVRTEVREETKLLYDKKNEEMKKSYEETIAKIRETADSEIKSITKSKDETIAEKNKLLDSKDKSISELMNQIQSHKMSLNSMLNQFIEKTSDDVSSESLKIKNQLLEKRLNKLEKSKVKCAKIYESKLAQLQREKHFVECSLQLQLVKQRAQVVTEMTDANQSELSTSLQNLESKYKDIVANVQATAIQRRIQDQRLLESILQATCGMDDQTQYSVPVQNHNRSLESENSTFSRNNKPRNVSNTSYGADSMVPSFCLNGDRMGELFERVCIPQRDNCNGETN